MFTRVAIYNEINLISAYSETLIVYLSELDSLWGSRGFWHHPRDINQLAPDPFRGDLITHVAVSPLSAHPEVILSIKLIGLPEKIVGKCVNHGL